MNESKRDAVLVALCWTGFLALAIALAGCSMLAPTAYVLFWLVIFCGGIFCGSIAAAVALIDSNPIGFLFVGDLVKAGLELMLIIARAMLGV